MVKIGARLKARKDGDQMVLKPRTDVGFGQRAVELPKQIEMHIGQFLCPFCLHAGTIGSFLIQLKKGFSSSRGRCPECDNGFMLESLTKRMTPEQFAQWVYEYPFYYYWKKCAWLLFNQRLKKIGWSYRFWKAYKACKEEDRGESYEEHMMKEQEEWARERGYI